MYLKREVYLKIMCMHTHLPKGAIASAKDTSACIASSGQLQLREWGRAGDAMFWQAEALSGKAECTGGLAGGSASQAVVTENAGTSG